MCVLSHFCRVQLLTILWTVVPRAPLSVGFSRQAYWCGLPCSPPGDLSDPGMEPTTLTSPALAGGFFITSPTWKAPKKHRWLNIPINNFTLAQVTLVESGEISLASHLKNHPSWNFTGGPLAKTLSSQCWGPCSIPALGTGSHMPQLSLCMPQ